MGLLAGTAVQNVNGPKGDDPGATATLMSYDETPEPGVGSLPVTLTGKVSELARWASELALLVGAVVSINQLVLAEPMP